MGACIVGRALVRPGRASDGAGEPRCAMPTPCRVAGQFSSGLPCAGCACGARDPSLAAQPFCVHLKGPSETPWARQKPCTARRSARPPLGARQAPATMSNIPPGERTCLLCQQPGRGRCWDAGRAPSRPPAAPAPLAAPPPSRDRSDAADPAPAPPARAVPAAGAGAAASEPRRPA